MKKIIIFLFTAAVSVSFKPFSANGAAEEKPGYVYTIIDNQATITGFSGEPTYIEIPETVDGCRVTEIRDNAFYECGALKHIDLPDTIEKIGHHSFYGCYSLESINIPDSVTEIGMGCFCGCEALSSVTISCSVSRLPESCFRSCKKLKNILLPENITEIGDFCFSGCTALNSVILGDSLTTIGDCAFYMCSSMTSMYVPDSAKNIGMCSIGYIPTDSGASTIEGFMILGKKKSAAKKYADENHLTFENAEDNVHAFAVQKISGKRIPIPSVFIIAAASLILVFSIFSWKSRRRSKKHRSSKTA